MCSKSSSLSVSTTWRLFFYVSVFSSTLSNISLDLISRKKQLNLDMICSFNCSWFCLRVEFSLSNTLKLSFRFATFSMFSVEVLRCKMNICLILMFVFFNLSTIVSIQIYQGFAGQSYEIRTQPEWFISGCDLKRYRNAAADDQMFNMSQNKNPISGISDTYVMNQRKMQCYYKFSGLQLSGKYNLIFISSVCSKGLLKLKIMLKAQMDKI